METSILLSVVYYGILFLIMAIPLVIVVAVFYAGLSHSRMLQNIARRPCLKCHKALGKEAISKAHEQYAKEFEELMAKHPRMRSRVIAKWKIECPHCQTWMSFTPNRYPGPEDLVIDEDMAVLSKKPQSSKFQIG